MKKILLLFTTLSFLCANEREIPLENLFQTELKIKDQIFNLWLALSPKQQQEGLSSLDAEDVKFNEGMLFIYPMNSIQTFWMKDTLINLDIAFIHESGEICNIYTMEEKSQKCFSSTKRIRYVLELRQGVFEELNLSVGDKIELSILIKEFSQS
jgi:uncharacterized membrane protein (UPF0127 family)